jgi:hypothetical protein
MIPFATGKITGQHELFGQKMSIKGPISLIGSDDDERDRKVFGDKKKRTGCTKEFVRKLNALTGFGMRALGPCLVVLGVAILCIVAYVQFVSIIPLLPSWSRWLHVALSLYLMVRILAHYTLVVFTKPGSPTPKDLTEEEIADLRSSPFEGYCSKVCHCFYLRVNYFCFFLKVSRSKTPTNASL